MMKNLIRDEQGQDLAEYGIALAVIAVGAASVAYAIGVDITALWNNAHDILHGAADGGGH